MYIWRTDSCVYSRAGEQVRGWWPARADLRFGV